MRATSSSDTLYLSGQAVLREGITKPPAKTTYEDIQLVDITDEVLSLVSKVNHLFTGETQTELRLSATQKKINEVKADFNEYSDILGASDKETVNNGLIKAQQLLDEIDTSVSIVDLEDSISKDASHTIRGTTYPNAFLYFSSDADIILDGELSSEVEGDPKKYQMRADKEGHFNYTLEEGKYFKAKEIVTISGMLNGKETLQKFVVKDTTPPEQPTFNSLEDKTNYFSGTAEASAMIKVYDTSDNSLVLYGNTDVDGTYSLTIPESKKPLIPYQKYYVTATDIAGNVSLQSKKQQVADTTAPTADPVKQVLTLGDSLPEISTFISHLYDNAGAENVTVSFKKKPDISKVEYTTAEILLTDKSGNNQVVNVPVIIKDTETQLDENNMLTASEFTIPAIYYPETESEKRQFLIEKSQLLAWDIGNGKDVKAQVILDKQLLERKPGMYQIVFMVGNLKKEISVTLTSGTLAFKKFQRKFHLEQPKFNRRSS